MADGIDAEKRWSAPKTRLVADAIYAQDKPGRPAGSLVWPLSLATGQTIEDVQEWPARIEAVTPEEVLAGAAAKMAGSAPRGDGLSAARAEGVRGLRAVVELSRGETCASKAERARKRS